MKRASQKIRQPSLFTPGMGRPGSNALRQVFVNEQQMRTLRHLFETHPTIVAASQVLESQILSTSLTLKFHGERVELTPEFRAHVDAHWSRFAREVMIHYLVYGFCVVSFEEELLDCATTLPSRKRLRTENRDVLSGGVATGGGAGLTRPGPVEGPSPRNSRTRSASARAASKINGSSGNPLAAFEELGRFVEENLEAAISGTVDAYIIPVVAPPETYRVSFEMTGRGGYMRRYKIYRVGEHHGLETDDDVVLFLRDPPDANGNINSPMAAVHAISSFVDGLVDMASIAEVSRAQPALVTQVRKNDRKDGVNAEDMFFDSESREINRDRASEENEAHARATQLQLQLCRALNQMSGRSVGAGLGSGSVPGSSAPRPQAEPQHMYTLPVDQEVAPHAPVPQTRTDLHDLLRISVDFMCTAMGVPSSLIFEGRFASRSTAQLSLLNSTVKQLAKELDNVLTVAYTSIYNEEDVTNETMDAARVKRIMPARGVTQSGRRSSATAQSQSAKRGANDTAPAVEFVTTTSPLSSVDEVLALFTGGIADFQAAAPLALNAVGLSSGDIEAALDRHEKREKELEKEASENKKKEEEDRATSRESQKLALEAQKVSLQAGKGGGDNAVQHLAAAGRSAGGGGGSSGGNGAANAGGSNPAR